jgi:hypothetical protein
MAQLAFPAVLASRDMLARLAFGRSTDEHEGQEMTER